MRILVNDIAASTGGALSILNSFYKFAKQDKDNEYIFLLSDNYLAETKDIRIIKMTKNKRWINRLKFDLISGEKFIEQLNVDIILSLQNTIVFRTKIKQIVYIHQSIPFQKEKIFSFLRKEERKLAIIQRFIGYIIKKSIKKANLVIVQAEWMKEAVIEKTKIDKNKIFIINPEINIDKNIKTSESLKTNRFFYPASNAIYKNHECIYEACKILKNKGIDDYKIDLTVEPQKNNIENINYLGYIEHEEVLKKYQDSVLIFPSYIETVGLPLVEAKKIGTIILASDCEFSREVLKNYVNGYFFNPFKPEELANLIEKTLNNKIQKKECIYETINTNNSWSKIFLNI